LALDAVDLPGLRAAERGVPYGDGDGWGVVEIEAGALPRLRVVGQIDDTLIVCESELGTLLLDQHRAHERVLYERLQQRGAHIWEPVARVELSADLDLLAHDRRDDLTGAGWAIRPLGACTWEVGATPATLEPADLSGVLHQMLAEHSDDLLAAAACHAAIRKRRPLSPAAAAELLEALTQTAHPTTCPHGQPIVLRLDRRFLERQFAWR
jgi:DNA mismatch repair protein MutL